MSKQIFPIPEAMQERLIERIQARNEAMAALEEDVRLAQALAGAPAGAMLRDVTVGFEIDEGEDER